MPCARVLVTGGAGYVGSHVCRALARARLVPVVFDDLSSGHRDLVRFGPLLAGDVCDAARVAAACAEVAPVAIVHLAPSVDVAASLRAPAACRARIVGAVRAVARAALAMHPPPPVVFTSSAAAGAPSASPYGAAKRAAERLLRACERAHGLRSMRLRVFNAVGASACGTLGERHRPETHLVPLAARAALGRGAPLRLFSAGGLVRDYIDVEVVARAHVAALEALLSGVPSATLDVGSGCGRSARVVVDALERVARCRVPWVCSAPRAGDAPSLVAASGPFRSLIGVGPSFPRDFDSVLSSAWRWHVAGERSG